MQEICLQKRGRKKKVNGCQMYEPFWCSGHRTGYLRTNSASLAGRQHNQVQSSLWTKQLGADSQFKMESGFLACFSTFRNATCTYLNQPSWLHKLSLQNTGSPAELIRIIGLFEVKLKTTYAATRELHSRIWFYWVLIYGLVWNGVFQKQAPKCKLSCFQRGGEACDC